MQDMIRLDKLKKLIFWDFDRADKIIQNLQDKRAGKTPKYDVRTRRNDRSPAIIDDPLVPLSYSGIINPTREITYIDNPVTTRHHTALFVETFDNRYFNACISKQETNEKSVSTQDISQRRSKTIEIPSEKSARVSQHDSIFKPQSLIKTSNCSYKTAATISLQNRSARLNHSKQMITNPFSSIESKEGYRTVAYSQGSVDSKNTKSFTLQKLIDIRKRNSPLITPFTT